MFEDVKEIILKVTRDCNLRCEYCYIREKDKYSGERMSFEQYQKLIKTIANDKKRSLRPFSPSRLSIVFHGGEPTLLGISEFTKFINYAKEMIPGAYFSIQTNLTNITPEWTKFFRENYVVVGTSVDGVFWQDSILRSKTSVLHKLELLRKSNVSYGILMVLNRENVKRFIKSAQRLLKNNPTQKRIKANFVENIYSSEFVYPEITKNDLYKYVFIPVMNLFFKTNNIIEDNVQNAVENFVQNLVFKQEKQIAWGCLDNCFSKFCGGGHTVVEVDPEGKVCFCGRWSDACAKNTLGEYTAPGDLFGLDSYSRILMLQVEKAKDIRIKHCDFCYASDVCSYGCIAFSYEKYNGIIKIRDDLICEYSKMVKQFLLNNIHKVLFAFVRKKGWEWKQDELYYYLNVVPCGLSTLPRDISHNSLCWYELEPGKKYLRVEKKRVRQKVLI